MLNWFYSVIEQKFADESDLFYVFLLNDFSSFLPLCFIINEKRDDFSKFQNYSSCPYVTHVSLTQACTV